MDNRVIQLLARSANAFAESEGLRTSTAIVVEQIAQSLHARFSFAALTRRDSSVADIIAAHGIAAADFRRLESRIAKSGLWRILDFSKPTAIDDLGADPVLKFLAFGSGSRLLLAVPIFSSGTAIGLLAVGFGAGSRVDEDRVIKILNVVSAMIAQAIRVERAVAEGSRKLVEENAHLKQELRERYDFRNLIGNSSQMRQVYDQVTQIARSNETLLLRGESGTGKDFIAHVVHYNSLRSKRARIKLNCASFPENLVDSELFGVKEGLKQKIKGAVWAADGGTLLLDEIDRLPLSTQVKLAGILRDGYLEQTGDVRSTSFNIRLVASTNQNLEAAIASGKFSDELFDRIKGFTILLPPLRERKSDILLLAEYFLEKYGLERKKNIRRLSTPAIDMLTAYHYPGNVRELENAIERAVIACDSGVIHGHHLPPTLQTAENSGTETRVTLASAVAAFERDMIMDALKSTRGNVAKAAGMLDSTERILSYKMKKYALNSRRFRR